MSFDAFMETARADHADQPDPVATRLERSLGLVDTPAHVPAYARLVTHMFGEHLGQWQRGIVLLDALRKVPACDDSAPITTAIARGIATLRYAGGDAAALQGLSPEGRIVVLATASAAFAGHRRFVPAVSAYAEAVELAQAGLAAGSPAIRALAVGGNNLACALEEKPDRNSLETGGMVAAAEGALQQYALVAPKQEQWCKSDPEELGR
jgi:hypothetical protein